MILCLPGGSKERAGGKNIRAVYIDAFANRGINWRFAQTALQWFFQRGKDYFDTTSLET